MLAEKVERSAKEKLAPHVKKSEVDDPAFQSLLGIARYRWSTKRNSAIGALLRIADKYPKFAEQLAESRELLLLRAEDDPEDKEKDLRERFNQIVPK